MDSAPIWLVDDDASIRFVLEKALARAGLATRSFSRAPEVVQALQAGDAPQVLLSDIRMSGGSGLELLERLREQYPAISVIIMTAYSDLESAVGAFSRGAFEYLSKPFDIQVAVDLVRRALAHAQAHQVAQEAQDAQAGMGGAGAVSPARAPLPDLLGQAPAMQDVFRAIGRLAASTVTVLITGESGTGKELVARALHKHSPVAHGPFVAINTAAIPKDLLESELFGHEKGSFTGAQTLRRGRFEQAEGGTLFLDEIGDMPFELQTRLLRVLSDGQFYRVGGQQNIKVQARIIAATHQNLMQRVQEGSFREDLFHRLNVIRLQLPPLRDRAEDIPILVQHHMHVAARKLGISEKSLSAQAMQLLQQFAFPGNVRQLENVCHWLTVMSPGQMVQVQDLPTEILQSLPHAQAVEALPEKIVAAQTAAVAAVAEQAVVAREALSPDFLPSAAPSNWQEGLHAQVAALLRQDKGNIWDLFSQQFEQVLIQAALEHTGDKRTEAALKLGIGRNTMTRKCQELGLD